jgi:hypothetical protein
MGWDGRKGFHRFSKPWKRRTCSNRATLAGHILVPGAMLHSPGQPLSALTQAPLVSMANPAAFCRGISGQQGVATAAAAREALAVSSLGAFGVSFVRFHK